MTEFEAASRKIRSRSADRGMERHPISHCGTCAQLRARVRVNDLLTTPCWENMACKTFNRTSKPVRQSCRLISAMWNQVSRVETFAEAFGPGLAVDSLFQPGSRSVTCRFPSRRRRDGSVACKAMLEPWQRAGENGSRIDTSIPRSRTTELLTTTPQGRGAALPNCDTSRSSVWIGSRAVGLASWYAKRPHRLHWAGVHRMTLEARCVGRATFTVDTICGDRSGRVICPRGSHVNDRWRCVR